MCKKLIDKSLSVLGQNLLNEATGKLIKYGFDWIALKLIFQCPEGQKKIIFGYFATFWQFLQNQW